MKVLVLAIERRNGVCSLIARGLKPNTKGLVRVLLCPLFSTRLKIYPGSELTLKRFTSFDLTPTSQVDFHASLSREFSISTLSRVILARDYAISVPKTEGDDEPEDLVPKEEKAPTP